MDTSEAECLIYKASLITMSCQKSWPPASVQSFLLISVTGYEITIIDNNKIIKKN